MLVTILTNAKDCSDGFSGNGKNTNTDILDGNDLRANIVCADTQIITIAATVNQIVPKTSAISAAVTPERNQKKKMLNADGGETRSQGFDGCD